MLRSLWQTSKATKVGKLSISPSSLARFSASNNTPTPNLAYRQNSDTHEPPYYGANYLADLPKRRRGLIEKDGETQKLFFEDYCNHRQNITFVEGQSAPLIDDRTFVAPNATLGGPVMIQDHASIWYGCTLRADTKYIAIGNHTNVQDNSIIECVHYQVDFDHDGSCVIGHHTTIGHGCTLRATTVENHCIVGMGSVLDVGSYMEERSQLMAGSVLEQNTRVPSGQLWGGNPARYIRDLEDDEKHFAQDLAIKYYDLAQYHREELLLPGNQHRDATEKGYETGYKGDLFKDIQ